MTCVPCRPRLRGLKLGGAPGTHSDTMNSPGRSQRDNGPSRQYVGGRIGLVRPDQRTQGCQLPKPFISAMTYGSFIPRWSTCMAAPSATRRGSAPSSRSRRTQSSAPDARSLRTASSARASSIEDEVFVGHGVMFTNDRYPRATNPDGSPQTEADWKVEPTIVRQRRLDRLQRHDRLRRDDRRRGAGRRGRRGDAATFRTTRSWPACRRASSATRESDSSTQSVGTSVRP